MILSLYMLHFSPSVSPANNGAVDLLFIISVVYFAIWTNSISGNWDKKLIDFHAHILNSILY